MQTYSVTLTDGIVAADNPFTKSFKAHLEYKPEEFIFGDNTKYNQSICKLALLLAADIYAHCAVTFENNKTTVADVLTLYSKLELNDCQYVELKKEDFAEDRNDLTSAVFAHKEYELGQKKQSIIFAVLRGTDGTYEQWHSNLDLGPGIDFAEKTYFEKTGNHPDWQNRFNHKGLDVAANRIDKKLKAYLERYTDFEDAQKILFVTGHSRGAGIANILGAKYEKLNLYKTFTYTFGGPRATTFQDKNKNIKTVFNLVNKDDVVPFLTAAQWGFTNYGTDIFLSVSEYSTEWQKLLGVKYKSAKKFLETHVPNLEEWINKLASSRNDFCKYSAAPKNALRNPGFFYGRKYVRSTIEKYGLQMFAENLKFARGILSAEICPGYITPALAAIVSMYTQGGMKNVLKILKFYFLFLSRHKDYANFSNMVIGAGSVFSSFSLQRSHSITSYYLLSQKISSENK